MLLPDHSVCSRLSDADTVVLCVHGIQGSPGQFDWLTKNIPEQIDYQCILLPGHGKTNEEFIVAMSRIILFMGGISKGELAQNKLMLRQY